MEPKIRQLFILRMIAFSYLCNGRPHYPTLRLDLCFVLTLPWCCGENQEQHHQLLFWTTVGFELCIQPQLRAENYEQCLDAC